MTASPFSVNAGDRQASLTGGQESIVQRVPISDRAPSCSGRKLNRSRARVHRLVDSAQHAAISRIVLQGEDATLDGRLPDTGEGDAVAAEAISSRQRVPQQDDARIAVILKRNVKG